MCMLDFMDIIIMYVWRRKRGTKVLYKTDGMKHNVIKSHFQALALALAALASSLPVSFSLLYT